MSRDTGDIDDAAATAFGHGRSKFLTRQQHASDQIQIEVGVPIFQSDFLERMLGGNRDLRVIATGAIDQNGRGTKGSFNAFVSFGQATAGDGVGREKSGRPALSLDGFNASLSAVGIASDNGNFGI